MAKKKKDKQEEVIVDVEEVYSKTERFIEENQRIILSAVGVVIAVIVIFIGWNRFYIKPLQKEATSQMFKAERYFEKDSFRLALEGDAQYPGFLDIADEFGMTDAGNLAHYYAGISYLHLGQYEEAIEYLEKFDSDDLMLDQMADGAIGDAYMELGKPKKAIDHYKEAANDEANKFRTPVFLMKAGLAAEQAGDYSQAKEFYERINKDYPESQEGSQVAKYIARAEAQMN